MKKPRILSLALSLITTFSVLSSPYIQIQENTHISSVEDVNQDGIKDSINTFITSISNKRNKAALTLYAIALQHSLSVVTKDEAAIVNNQLITASRCILLTTKSKGDIYQPYEMGEIKVMTINTGHKQHDYARFMSLCYEMEQSVNFTDCNKMTI
ncbi:hypothetical protein [Photobacterium iliopiscarium]|uniref:hypothetical protein n=1 Tax=Photobacterium iliopiscarium TaxID=56192 RepID=UPI001E3BF2E9|nr:hypothetical protein [Photobacterium iliopiscarium]MCD9485894.1 hypothetical protein [Photobacterium iliopiscarium]MCF2242591.1 hypothetical protein [Photobacterium iliopiscarium]